MKGSRQTGCALQKRAAMLAVRQYGCASRPLLLPLATVLRDPDTVLGL